MKNPHYVFWIAGSITITSCQKTPTEELLSEYRTFFEKEMLQKFNDPASYQEVSIEIIDTVSQRESAQQLHDDIFSESARKQASEAVDIFTESKRLTKETNDDIESILKRAGSFEFRADSSQAAINKIPEDMVSHLVIKHSYRAKNGFGALDLGEFEFHCHPGLTDPKEKFRLQSKE